MIIGYGFLDDHINLAIRDAVKVTNLELFVVDLLGVDVMDANRDAQIYSTSDLAKDLWPNVIGSSRRSLRETFGDDHAEHKKIMRFFE